MGLLIQKYFFKIKQQLVFGVIVFSALLFLATFYFPLRYAYSYSGDNCHAAPLLFPGIARSSVDGYTLTPRGDNAFFASTVCIAPESAPQPGTKTLALGLAGLPLMGRSFIIDTPARPSVTNLALDAPIAATKPLKITLSDTDTTHTYALKVNDTRVACYSRSGSLECPLKQAGLAQGAEYEIMLVRSFKDDEEVLVRDKKMKTLTAATVTNTSIAKDGTVYDKPMQAVFTLDKGIRSATAALVGTGGVKVSVQVRAMENEVIVSWAEELLRNTSYTLELQNVEALDGSDIVEPYSVPFRVSGGPKVTQVSAGKAGVGLSAPIVITFDQEIAVNQEIAKIVSFTGGNARIQYGPGPTQVTVQLLSLPKCADIAIAISKELRSKYEVPSEDVWSYSSRTTCHTIETVGYSQKRRAINAYYFGEGATTILYTGAIHGNEASASYILQDFIAYLEVHAREIPKDRRVVVVPTVNPDGFASGSRFNANNVNLNRNFATSDWKKDIKDTGGTVAGGGGSEPMSEPETKVIAALASRLRPRLVLSYHAVGSVAIANQAGHSTSMAQTYSALVGYRNGTGASSEIFAYEITGTFDDWLAEKLGVASVLVELGSYTYRNFSHHREAMWTALAN